MTSGTKSDAESDSDTLAAATMQNNKVVAATENEKDQQQTLLGDTKDTSEPQESGSKDKSLNVEVVNHNRNTTTSTTSSLGEAQDEGNLQGKFNIGKREETDLSDDDKLRNVGKNQNANVQQQQQVLAGERETKSSDIINAKGQEDDQVNTIGKGEDTDLSADDTMGIAHDVRQIQNSPENVQLRQKVLKGTRETKSSESIKVRGLEDDKIDIGKGEETGLAADDTMGVAHGVRQIQNSSENVQHQQQQPQQPVLKGERETEPSETTKARRLEDDRIKIGKGEETDLAADGKLSNTQGVRQIQNSPENVQQQQQVLKGKRETESSENVKARGQEDDQINSTIGKGEETNLSADDSMDIAQSARQMQNSPENVQQQQQPVLKGKETKSSETIKARGLEDDKINIGKGEDSDLAAGGNLRKTQGVRQIHNSPEQQQQVLKGKRETESSEIIKAKGQADDKVNVITGKREATDLSADDTKGVAQGFKRNQRNSGTAKQILLRRKKQSSGPGGEDVKQDAVEEKEEGKGMSSAVESRDSESGIRKMSETVVEGGKQQAEIQKGVSNNPSTESVPRKGKREREQLQSPVRSSPQGLRSNEGDRMREAAAMPHRAESILLHGQEYRAEMAARSLLMHSTPPSYFSGGLGLPPPPPYYSPYYHPAYPPPYVLPYVAPLPHHHLHHPHPHPPLHDSLEYYERAREEYRRAQGEASRMYHLLPAEAKVLVQARSLGQPMHNVPTTSDAALRNHPPPTQEAEAEALRAVAESHRLGPSIRGVPIAPSGASRSHRSEFEALRAVAQSPFLRPSGVPMPAMSGMAHNNPSRPTAAHRRASATSRSMRAEALTSADSSVSEELPSGAHPSMDEGMSDRARRERKNAQSRIRTNRLRKQLEEIRAKRPEERTAEEQRLFNESEARRQKKNLRSRARATEKKEAIDRILSIPPEERSKEDAGYYNLVTGQKKRKIEGDKLRRVRIKDLGLPSGQKAPGVPARGPLPQEYQYMSEDSDQMKKRPFQGPYDEA